MSMPRPARETKAAMALGDPDSADAGDRADRDCAKHLLPRRWRPRKPDTTALDSLGELGDVTCERPKNFRAF